MILKVGLKPPAISFTATIRKNSLVKIGNLTQESFVRRMRMTMNVRKILLKLICKGSSSLYLIIFPRLMRFPRNKKLLKVTPANKVVI
jgi:hypothetical protein